MGGSTRDPDAIAWPKEIGCQCARLALEGAFVCLAASAASAEDAASKDGIPNPSIATMLPQNGDPFGWRADLASQGIAYSVNYISETLGNAGGLSQACLYGGRLEIIVDADLEKLWGFKGVAFRAHAFQIHGAGQSRQNLDNILTVSSTEALQTSRLFELYLEHKADGYAVRLGQLAADTEFFVAASGANFVNATFGWPGIWAMDHPSGGDAYPLATPGVRVKYEPSNALTFLAAMFDGDPAGPGVDDPQARDRYGLNFRVKDPPLFMQEAQFKYNQDKNAPALPGTVKIGAWQHVGNFDDQRHDANGVSMALSHGAPARRRGDYGFYVVAEQQLLRLPSDADHGVHAFARLSESPEDRDPIDLYADGGLVFKGFIPSRADDQFGIAFAYARISHQASALDRERNAADGTRLPVRDYEALLEVYYRFQILPGLTVQPDVQYIAHPDGHEAQDNGVPIRDAVVAGVRVGIAY
jgi:porin